MMNTLRTVAMSFGLPVALLAGATQSATATIATDASGGPQAAPTTTIAPAPAPAVAAFPPPTGAVPADWPILVDDTQTIAVAVPGSWSQTDLVPAQNDDGTPRPWISATTDENLFFPADGAADTFSAPGVVYTAAPYEPDTVSPLTGSAYNELCTAEPLQTFDNGIFVGHIQAFSNCALTPSRIIQLAVHPADLSFTARVLIQLTGQPDDAATLNGVLLSFGRVVPPPATG